MKFHYRLLLVLASASFFYASAQAQNSGTVTNHAVPVGKGPGVTGYTNVVPSTAGIPLTSTGASTDPSFSAIAAAGIQSNAVTNAKINPGASNTFKGSLNGSATSDIALTACTLSYQITKWVAGTGWQCGLNPVLPSRAVAVTLDLSAFNAVQTQGYTSPGDGGGALFRNNTTAAYLDVQPLTGTISAAGTGYVNGSYTGVPLANAGTCRVIANVTVAGTAVTGVTLIGLKGTGCKATDVTSTGNTNLGGSGSGFTWTVSTVSSPTGSFADTAGNHFQITVDAGNDPNLLQFGAKGDWTSAAGDASATDNATPFTNAQVFVSGGVGSIDAGGYTGGTVIVPRGAFKICGGVITADGSDLRGVSPTASVLKQCDSDSAATHFVTICNPQTLKACFGGSISNIQLFAGSGSANSNISMIYTNNSQQLKIVDNVTVYSQKRMCLFGETGYGGAANFVSDTLFCTVSGISTQSTAIAVTYGAAAITLTNTIVESGSAFANNGLLITSGGVWSVRGWHSENIATPIFVNVPSANTTIELMAITGGNNCTSVVTRQGGSTANITVLGRIHPNGCTNAINNAGAFTTGLIVDNTKI
jgi:hypothetical protein